MGLQIRSGIANSVTRFNKCSLIDFNYAMQMISKKTQFPIMISISGFRTDIALDVPKNSKWNIQKFLAILWALSYSPSDHGQLRVPSISSGVLALTWVPPAPGSASPSARHENFFMSKELLNNFERVWLQQLHQPTIE